MGYNHQRIKENAKKFYQINMGNAILVPFIMSMIAGVATSVFSMPLGIIISFSEVSHGSAAASATISLLMLVFYALIFGITFFVINILQIGCCNWFRRRITENCGLDCLFGGFKAGYLRNVGTMALMTLYVFLWSLLLLVPGIIKTYSYSMTTYIRGEFPELSASESINLSAKLTDGHKGDLFYLDLSFMGWSILSAFTMNILAIVYVIPYYNAAKAFAYEECKADAIANGRFVPQYSAN